MWKGVVRYVFGVAVNVESVFAMCWRLCSGLL